jgi:hypothetical protein
MTDAAEVRRLPRRSGAAGPGRPLGGASAPGSGPDERGGPVRLGDAMADLLADLAAGRDPAARDHWDGTELAEAG